MRSKQPALRSPRVCRKVEKRAIPKVELDFEMDKTLSLSTLRSFDQGEVVVNPSRDFVETPPKDQQKLFLNKCKECCVICDFSSPLIGQRAIQTKTALLRHLVSSFAVPQLVRSMQPEILTEFYKMLGKNLFRAFPTLPVLSPIDVHDSLYDASWPHLSLAYEALSASLSCQMCEQCITSSFLYKLIANGASPDDREKVVVRDILHAMYTKFMSLRDLIRNNMANQFINGVISTGLLEFLVSVVSGFNSPLKQDHIDFYYKCILPLHSSPKFTQVQVPLVQCVYRFISKSPILFSPTILYIIKHWPCSDRRKQIDMLNELSFLAAGFEMNVTPKMAVLIFRLVGSMVLSENPDVSEAAIDVLMNPDLASILKNNASAIFPLIIEPVYRAAKSHWDECTKSNAYVALQVLSEIDSNIFNRANEAHKMMKAQRAATHASFKNNWSMIFDGARANDKTIVVNGLEGLKDKNLS